MSTNQWNKVALQKATFFIILYTHLGLIIELSQLTCEYYLYLLFPVRTIHWKAAHHFLRETIYKNIADDKALPVFVLFATTVANCPVVNE